MSKSATSMLTRCSHSSPGRIFAFVAKSWNLRPHPNPNRHRFV